MSNSVVSFIKYWYFRYLLVTELYMVEKWERVMMHCVLFTFLGIIYLFNAYVTLGLTSSMVKKISMMDIGIPSILQLSPMYGESSAIMNAEL